MRKVIALAAGAAFALVGATSAVAQAPAPLTPEAQVQAIVEPSIVYLESHWTAYVKLPISGIENTSLGPFEWGARCTGFIVSPQGHIVTAGHCVDNTNEGARRDAILDALRYVVQTYQPSWTDETLQRILIDSLDSAQVTGRSAGSAFEPEVYVQRGVATSGLKTSETFRARTLAFNSLDKGDVALLKIEASDLPALELSPSASVQVGTPVLSVGYPGTSDLVADESLTPTLKDGKINSLKTREDGSLPVYEMSAALSGGMSGGPTVDMDGRVVGLNSFKIDGETEAFNWLSPSSLIAELLSQNAVKNELSPIDRSYREGIALLAAGDGKAAIPHFEEVLAQSPSHQKAQELLRNAEAVAATQSSFPVVPVAAGVVLVLLVIAFLVLRGRKRPAAPAGPPAEPATADPTEAASVVSPVTPAEGNGHGSLATEESAAAHERPAEGGSTSTPTSVVSGSLRPAAASEDLASGSSNGTPIDVTEGGTERSAAPTTTKTGPRHCPACGGRIAKTAKFCPACGQQV